MDIECTRVLQPLAQCPMGTRLLRCSNKFMSILANAPVFGPHRHSICQSCHSSPVGPAHTPLDCVHSRLAWHQKLSTQIHCYPSNRSCALILFCDCSVLFSHHRTFYIITGPSVKVLFFCCTGRVAVLP